ncbi:MAG: hypothetical protein AB7P00_05710 [Sandaracinaceae bacterium]
MEHPPEADDRVERAAEAWASLDATTAARLADEALRISEDPRAAEIAARAHLALFENERAVAALEGRSEPELVQLRALAQIAADDYEGALASLHAAIARQRDEDPLTLALEPAIAAALERGARYEVVGEPASVELVSTTLPIVRVRVDAVETLALIGSGTQLAVLDPSVRREPGAIDELGLGSLRVRNVPHLVRSLEAVRQTLGVEVGAVLGTDLLFALHARIDGPGGRVRFGASPEPSPEGSTHASLRMLSGSFLAVEARLGRQPAWLTVDTSGLFPIALTPTAAEGLGIAEDEWTSAEGGLAMFVAPAVRIGALEVEGLPLVRGLLTDEHARAAAAPVAGSVGWTLLAQLVTRFDRENRTLAFE